MFTVMLDWQTYVLLATKESWLYSSNIQSKEHHYTLHSTDLYIAYLQNDGYSAQ